MINLIRWVLFIPASIVVSTLIVPIIIYPCMYIMSQHFSFWFLVLFGTVILGIVIGIINVICTSLIFLLFKIVNQKRAAALVFSSCCVVVAILALYLTWYCLYNTTVMQLVIITGVLMLSFGAIISGALNGDYSHRVK